MNPQDLLPGERMLVRSTRHWVVLLRPFATTVLAMAISLVVVGVLSGLAAVPGELRLFLILGVILVGLGVLNLYYWGWRAHEYVLTDQRVILNEGILSKFSRSIAIDRIQDLTTFQGLWGRTWGFGDIELESAGREGAELLSTVPRPQQLRNAIFGQIEARRRQGGSANP
jgi:uncharacterized membrane protein YdbT with pleckstrin-like domain